MSSESSALSGGLSTTSSDAALETTTTEETVTFTSTSEENSQQTQTSESNTKTETTNSSFPDSTPPSSTVSDTASTPSPITTGHSSNDDSPSTSITTSIADSDTVVPTDVPSSAPTSPASPTSVEETDTVSSTLPLTTAPPTNGPPANPTMEPTTSEPTSPPTDTTAAPPVTDPTTISEESTSAPLTDSTTAPTDPTTTQTDPTTVQTDPTTAPTDPTTAPTNPTTAPTDPTTLQTDPTMTPTDPTTVPADPTTAPTDPTTVQTDPTTVQTDPTMAPTEPTTVRTDPSTAPTDPTTIQTDPTTVQTGTTTAPTDPTSAQDPYTTQTNPTTVQADPTTATTEPITVQADPSTPQTDRTTAPTDSATIQPTNLTSVSSADPTSVAATVPSTQGTATPTTILQETTSGAAGTASTVIVSAANPASSTLVGGTLTVSGATVTASGSGVRGMIDAHTEVNVSDLNILTQSAYVKPEPLTLSSVTVVSYVTTEFTTVTKPDGSITLIPTKTTTIVGTITPTYSIQPNEFERNKGPIIGLTVVAAILALIAIGIGIWVCRRRRRQVVGRRNNLSPVGDVVTGPVLIRGHSVPGRRSLASQEWRPPLVAEVGDEDHDDLHTYAGQTPLDAMSERERFRPSIPAPLMRANSYGSAEEGTRAPLDIEVSTLSRSTGESSRDTMQFTTSLLSFDVDPATPQIVTSRFSDTSSSQSAARTASLISLSAEPTPLDGRFSMSSISIPESSGTIPVISPFADSFSTEAARNSYWGNSGQVSRKSSTSSNDSGQPIRFSPHKQSGWREAETEDAPSRMRGGRASTQDVIFQASNPFDDESTPSLMSQISLISAQSPPHSASSLLNPPLRPRWTGTLSDLGQRSGPSKAPSLPPIPSVASPALTDDSFHAEGLLADPAYAQSRSGSLQIPQRPDLETQDSFSSLLDHVDYSMPITSNVNPFDDEITFSKSTGSEESSTYSVTPEPQSQHDFLNDVRPVLSVLQKRAQTSREALQSQ
ncbi:hypothetical protein WG66_016164 [Moniliophthora roreri]|nr:hypothetical protein WG66_016164 [Moniliophthora roreri]